MLIFNSKAAVKRRGFRPKFSMRIANIYFLALSVLCLIPEISPWDPVTQIAPTVFVLGIAIIREAIEDYYRYKSDTLSNK